MKKIVSTILLLLSLLSPIAVFADEVSSTIPESPSIESPSIPDNIPIYYGKNEEGNTLITIQVTPNLAGGCIFTEQVLNEIESTQTTSENIPCAIWSLDGEPIIKLQDEEAGVDHVFLNARYYDGTRGRFISQDPSFVDIGDSMFKQKYGRTLEEHLMNPQSLNSYSYANNNPVNLSDPNGEILPLIVIAAGVWAVAEIGLSAYDIYSTGETLFDENAPLKEKLTAVSLTTAGVFLPGGGYGKLGKEGLKLYKETNIAGRVLAEGVENKKILTLIRDNYRAGGVVGAGSTAEAIKYTAKTGTLVKGSDHIMKGQNTLNRIKNILKDRNLILNSNEIKVLEKVSNDLKDALKNFVK